MSRRSPDLKLTELPEFHSKYTRQNVFFVKAQCPRPPGAVLHARVLTAVSPRPRLRADRPGASSPACLRAFLPGLPRGGLSGGGGGGEERKRCCQEEQEEELQDS